MPTILGRVGLEATQDVVRRLLGPGDYFGCVLPSTWFFGGLIITQYLLFGESAILQVLLAVLIKGPEEFVKSNVGLGVLYGFLLLAIVFNTVYMFGHLLNSFSSLVIDRAVVRKLLHYPFHIYREAWLRRATDGHEVFRELVRSSTYGSHLLNVTPVIVVEFLVWAYTQRQRDCAGWIQDHPVGDGACDRRGRCPPLGLAE